MRNKFAFQPLVRMALAAAVLFVGLLGEKASAQEPSALETVLRKRVAEFYTLMRVKRASEAERLVTAETLEHFRNMPTGEFLSAQIQSIEFSKDEKSAVVNIGLTVSAANVPVPFELPRKTDWRLESDGWRIVIPPPAADATAAMFKSTAPKPGSLIKFDLHFAQPIVDLTPILQGEKKVSKFAFTNSAAYPVTIVDVLADCGCVVMKTEKKTYKPGEAGEIELEFDSTKYAYGFGQTVAIVTDPGAQRINLLLKASVTPKQ